MRSLSLFILVVSCALPACKQYAKPAATSTTNLQIETLHRSTWMKPILKSKKISYSESGTYFVSYTLPDERQLTYMGVPVDEVRCETDEAVLQSLHITLLDDEKRATEILTALQKQFGAPVIDTANDSGEQPAEVNYKWENDTIQINLERVQTSEKTRSADRINIIFPEPAV